ncbi:MAG: hypothetical protein JW807_11595 [Spirochaetes bacterium]|nr:hypothetical protein [Spirochaetota bacterium]
MKITLIIACLATALCTYAPLSAESMEDRVVSIIVTSQKKDYASPWQNGEISRSSIAGCVIAGNRILTSAYSMTDHVLVEVMKKGGPRRYEAEVLVKDYHCGLALLGVQDAEFFAGLKPAELAPAWKISGRSARVYKWDVMSSFKEYIAELTKSSIRYYEPNCGVVMHQFSTSMNDGGSGEPVFIDGKLAGIATGLNNETKTLYVLGVEVIRRMQKDVADGRYDGVPFFWVESMDVQGDVNLREYFGMGRGESGVFITEVPPISSGGDVLKRNDIILSIDGRDIDDNGMYDTPYGKLYYHGLIQVGRFVGETVSMKVLRDRRKIDVRFRLKPVPVDCCLIPLVSHDAVPRYYIFGGLLFQELTAGYLESFGREWRKKADKRLLYYYDAVKQFSAAGAVDGFVVLNRVLPDPVNRGYQYYNNLILKSANGVQVKDLMHLKKIVQGAASRFIVFEFVGETTVVIDRNAARSGEGELLKTYNISSPHSVPAR